MSEMKHTSEPWGIRSSQFSHIIVGSNGYGGPVADTDLLTSQASAEEVNANATRIVACVNACEGIKYPAAALDNAIEALEGAEHMLERAYCAKLGSESFQQSTCAALGAIRKVLALRGIQ